MTIGVITPIFDEEYLLPIFLEHYKFVDEITFFYDTDTTDKSLEVINKHKKTDVIIEEFYTGEGLNDYFMIDLLHKKLKTTSVDYSFCLDADELFFHPRMKYNTLGDDIKNHIAECDCDFFHACFYQMYPAVFESKDLLWWVPIWEQRRFGDYDPTYVKPCVVKTGANVRYSVGKHVLFEYEDTDEYNQINDNTPENKDFIGCHLNNINLQLAIERRLKKRKDRISRVNKERGAGRQYFELTEKDIRIEFGREYPKLW